MRFSTSVLAAYILSSSSVVVFGRTPSSSLSVSALEWLTMARIVRGQTLSIKRKEFIEAAQAGGDQPEPRSPPHHPQRLGPVVVYASLTVPEMIMTESFLRYLGLGVQEPQTSWAR